MKVILKLVITVTWGYTMMVILMLIGIYFSDLQVGQDQLIVGKDLGLACQICCPTSLR